MGVSKFIFVSSASVYGYQNHFPLFEGIEMYPASPYALTKLIGEQYCQLFEKMSIMKINRVRPFNAYGKRQPPGDSYAAAVPNFIEALKTGKKPFITGDGKQFRDFVYVEDVVDLMIKIMKSDVAGEAFNAGTEQHTSINALYETISTLMKKKVKPDYIAEVKDPNTRASMEKAERFFKWRPKHGLIEGLTKTI